MERCILLQCQVLVSFKTFITRKTKAKIFHNSSYDCLKKQNSSTVCQISNYFALLGCVLLNLFLLSVFFYALFNLKHPEPNILYQHFFLGSQSLLFFASFRSCSTLQHLARQCSTLKSLQVLNSIIFKQSKTI